MRALSAPGRLAGFVRERVPAHYALYGVLWSVAAEAGARLTGAPAGRGRDGSHWSPGPGTTVRAASLILTLAAMRMVDDVKDLDHDRVHSPDRPLVDGRVSVPEVVTGAAACTAAALALSVTGAGPVSAASLALVHGYGWVLWPANRALLRMRSNPWVELAVTYQVQLLATAHLLASSVETGAVRWDRRSLSVYPLFAGGFLQFELARKTCRPSRGDAPSPAEYSSVVPWRVCTAGIVLLGEVAVATLTAWATRARVPRAARVAPAALAVLPPLVVVEMISGRRSTPRLPVSMTLLLLLLCSVPALARRGTP